MKTKPFQYKRVKKAERVDRPRIQPPAEDGNQYSGQIDGMKAAEGEENLYNAAIKTGHVIGLEFRKPVGAPRGMPGQKELDFLITLNTGEALAIQVRDYDFVHKGNKNAGEDEATDTYILMKLKTEGVTVRGNKIITISDDDLATPELARKAVEDLEI
jgi:hypothetical protein